MFTICTLGGVVFVATAKFFGIGGLMVLTILCGAAACAVSVHDDRQEAARRRLGR
jgi:hypothetical protein